MPLASIIVNDRGSYPKPGEITLAHLGVLFLDELPEFDKKVLCTRQISQNPYPIRILLS